MISRSKGRSGGLHGDPASASTDGMITCSSGSMSSHHGYLANNLISSLGDPVNRKPKKIYAGENRYPIYIIQLDEVQEIAWKKKSGFDLLTFSVGPLSGGHSVSYLITLVENQVLL